LARLRQSLETRGIRLRGGPEAEQKLAYLRTLYEPYVLAMARNLAINLPPWIHSDKKRDNWQAGPWDRAIKERTAVEHIPAVEEHF
jgi:hypothetical protein